jgi:hypothetical protein
MSRLTSVEPWHYLVVDEDSNALFHPASCKGTEGPCCCETTPNPSDYIHVNINPSQGSPLKLVCGCVDCDPDRFLLCLECTFGNCGACEWRCPGYICLTDELVGEGLFQEDPGTYWVQGWGGFDYFHEYENGLTVERAADRPDLTILNQGILYDYEDTHA